MNELLNVLRRHPSWSGMVWVNNRHQQQATSAMNITLRTTIDGRDTRVDRAIGQWDMEQEGFINAHVSDVLQDMERQLAAQEGGNQPQ